MCFGPSFAEKEAARLQREQAESMREKAQRERSEVKREEIESLLSLRSSRRARGGSRPRSLFSSSGGGYASRF